MRTKIQDQIHLQELSSGSGSPKSLAISLTSLAIECPINIDGTDTTRWSATSNLLCRQLQADKIESLCISHAPGFQWIDFDVFGLEISRRINNQAAAF